jgi:hypothetical protein
MLEVEYDACSLSIIDTLDSTVLSSQARQVKVTVFHLSSPLPSPPIPAMCARAASGPDSAPTPLRLNPCAPVCTRYLRPRLCAHSPGHRSLPPQTRPDCALHEQSQNVHVKLQMPFHIFSNYCLRHGKIFCFIIS